MADDNMDIDHSVLSSSGNDKYSFTSPGNARAKPVKHEIHLPQTSPPIGHFMSEAQSLLRTTKRTRSEYEDDEQIQLESGPNDFRGFLSDKNIELWQEFSPEVISKLRESEEPFDPCRDMLPPSVFWSNEAEKVKHAISSFVEGFFEILQRPEYDSKDNRKLRNFLGARANPVYAKARRLGLQGSSGVGKSALINSLLGQVISESGTPGSAMTSVCIQITKKGKEYPTSLHAIVELRDPEARQDMFSAWIEYYGVMHKTSEQQAPTEVGGIDAIGQRGKTTIDNLHTMFCNRPEFESTEATVQWLDEKLKFARDDVSEAADHPPCNESDHTNVVMDLMRLAQLALEEHGVSSTERHINAGDTDELRKELGCFTRSDPEILDDGRMENSLWPLVERIKVLADAPLLQRGLELYDMPGLLDMNIARTKLTNSELRQCSEVAVVADISRALTDTSVWNALKKNFKSKGGKVMLILTGIDKTGESPLEMERILTKIGARRDSVGKFKRLTKFAECIQLLYDRAMEKDAPKRLRSSSKQLKKWSKAISILQREFLISVRNQHVAAKMCEQYKYLTSSDVPLKIHFVSNTEYAKHSSKDRKKAISLELTGIPRLRACLAEPFEKGLKTALHNHAVNKLGYLIDILDIYTSPDLHMQIGRVRGLIQGNSIFLTSTVARLVEGLLHCQQKHLVDPLQAKRKGWSQAACGQVDKWDKELSWQKFNAMIRSEGNDTSGSNKSRGGSDWNDVFFSFAIEDCKAAFTALKEAVEELFEHYGKEYKNGAQKLRSLDDYPSELDSRSKPVREVIEKTIKEVRGIIKDFKEEYQSIFAELEGELTEKSTNTFIRRATSPMFAKIIEEFPGGKGSVGKRKCALRKYVSNAAPYREIIKAVDTDFRRDIDDLEEEKTERCRKAVQEMIDNLSSAMSQHQNEDPKVVALRTALREQVLKARVEHRDQIIPAAERLLGFIQPVKQEKIAYSVA